MAPSTNLEVQRNAHPEIQTIPLFAIWDCLLRQVFFLGIGKEPWDMSQKGVRLPSWEGTQSGAVIRMGAPLWHHRVCMVSYMCATLRILGP